MGDNKNKKLKVVYVADQSEHGGASEALLEIACGLRDLELVDPIVMTAFNGALEGRLREKSIPFVRTMHRQFAYDLPGVGYQKCFFKALRPIYIILYRICNRYAIYRAEKYIDWNTVDLVHTNVNRNDIGGIMAKKHGIPHIWHLREHSQNHFELKFNRRNPMEYMNKLTTCFIAISDSVKCEWIKNGINPNKVFRLYDGNDFQRFKMHQFRHDKTLKIVVAGAICPAKGQWMLLEALQMLPKEICDNLIVDFYGDGSKSYIKTLKKYCKHNKFNFVNFYSYRKMNDILEQYDVGVNCSKNEGFGRTTVEYMATGLCTVALDSGATPELIKNGEEGFLFASVSELSNLLKELYYDRDKLSRIAQSGLIKSERCFNLNDYLHNIYSLYVRLIEVK